MSLLATPCPYCKAEIKDLNVENVGKDHVEIFHQESCPFDRIFMCNLYGKEDIEAWNFIISKMRKQNKKKNKGAPNV